MKKLIILALAMLTISLTGCGTSSPATTPAVVLPAYYVNAATGLDTNAGTQAAPFKTIAKALNMASTTNVAMNIFVAAGTYNAANGEVFPLTVASSATGAINLIGTGSPMLAGAGNYTVVGGEMINNAITTTLVFASGTKGSVTGFAASESVFAAPTVIVTDNATVSISNNKFDFLVNGGAYPLWLVNDSIVTVTGNTISGWVALDTADLNTKVTIRNNNLDGGFTVCTADFTPTASQLDLGTVASPGNNILLKTGIGGTAALNSFVPGASQSVITAVGNTWTPNVQWADAQGHYPAGVLTGASATNGPNLNIWPTAGVQLYVVPGSVAAPHTAKK